MSISSAVASISSAVSSIATGGQQHPISQKAGDRPITFGLVDASVPSSQIITLDMVIRPEELTRTDVSRATVQQTLGGGWVDDFGPGLATINISGTTGWRMNAAAQGNAAIDGVDQFAKLKTQTFTGWHKRRNDAVKAGKDPKLVTLFFVDTLDSTMDSVAPMNFTLRRSKSRPLLMQFNISMLVLSGTIYTTASQSVAASNPLASLLASINNIVNGIKNVINVVNGIVGQVTAYMQTATSLFQSVSNLINSAQAIPQSVLGAAKAMAQAGTTMFSTIAAIPGNSTSRPPPCLPPRISRISGACSTMPSTRSRRIPTIRPSMAHPTAVRPMAAVRSARTPAPTPSMQSSAPRGTPRHRLPVHRPRQSSRHRQLHHPRSRSPLPHSNRLP